MHAAHRLARTLSLAGAALVIVACGEIDDVTGLWRTLDQPLALVSSATASPCLDGAYVQLAVGQYGKDVAGVIKFFDSPQFIEERCPCSFVYSGRLRSGRLTFDFRQPATVDGEEDVWLRAELTLTPGEEPLLGGDIRLLGESARYGALSLDGQPRQRLSDDLKRCDPALVPGGGAALSVATGETEGEDA